MCREVHMKETLLPEKGETRGRKKIVVHRAALETLVKEIFQEAVSVVDVIHTDTVDKAVVIGLLKRVRGGLEQEIRELSYEKD